MTPERERAEVLIRSGQWLELEELLTSTPSIATELDTKGEQILAVCARYPGSASIIRLLGRLGADPNHRSYDGSTALSKAIISGSQHGETTIPETEALLDIGADPNLIADCGMPALHWAVSQNRLLHLVALLERGADTEQMTSDDPPESVLDIARRLQSTNALSLLRSYIKKQRR